MTFSPVPSGADVRAYIDGTAVGALKSFSERCVQNLTLVRELGSSDNMIYNRNGKEYSISLQYLLPLGCSLVDAPVDPVSLTSFTLMIQLPKRTLRFTDCVCASVETTCEAGGSILCRLQILARNRQCIDETE
ncbi:MAG: hypothetical protein E7434_06125 [Ruminococcaceae bacterium]|nr:hypothetical protein [Oscillospiraceae bacterium]